MHAHTHTHTQQRITTTTTTTTTTTSSTTTTKRYILEPLCAGYADEPERNVRLELITAAVKMFLKRAPESQRMLGQLFAKTLGEGDAPAGELDTDVHDRALMFYRLLQASAGWLGGARWGVGGWGCCFVILLLVIMMRCK